MCSCIMRTQHILGAQKCSTFLASKTESTSSSTKDWQSFSIKGHIINILDLGGHLVSVAMIDTTLLL